MRKYILLTFVFAISFCFRAMAQPNAKEKREQLQAAKIAYITTEIDLSPTQAEKFWPLYNEYSEAKRVIRQKLRKQKKKIDQELDSMSEDECSKATDNIFKLKQQEIDLDKKYQAKFSEVITNKQILKLYGAEKMFLKKLHDRIHKNRAENHPPH